MPNKVEKTPDGNLAVELETGEKFSGDPLEVTQKMAEAHVNTKRWGQDFKQKYESAVTTQPAAQPNPPPPVNEQDAKLQEYLVDQWAKGLGFKDGAEAKAQLGNVLQTTSHVHDQAVAGTFLTEHPDFPNTPEAIDAISKKLDAMGLPYNENTMARVHDIAVREGLYKPLTAEEQNAQWTAGLNAQNRASAPPAPPAGNTINSQGAPTDPWAMPLDQLRKQVLDAQLAGGK